MFLTLLLLACDGGDDPTDTSPVDTADTSDTGEVASTMEGCDARHDDFIAALQADLDASEAPGVSAAIMEGGEVTCRLTLGTKGAETDEQPTIRTLFQIGSTTKMFTALGLLQRVEAGGLSLETHLAEAYPESEFALDAGWNDAITLQHLLTHQGAFLDYVDDSTGSNDSKLASWYEGTYFPNLWLMADPGSFWNYSNPNFDVAGLVTEADDGRAYPDIMLESVFGPLGMARTMQRKSEVEADGDFAEGYGYYRSGLSYAYGPVGIDDVPDPASHRPAGVSTWTTPTQMMQMATFLIDGDSAILDDALRQAMTEPQVSLGYDFLTTAYGYGVMVDSGFETQAGERYALEIWNHNGNTNSYSSEFWIAPEQGFALSVLSAGYGTDFYGSVEAAITSLLELPAPTAVEDPVVDYDAIDRHVGYYYDPYNVGDFTITREGDALLLEALLLEDYGYDVGAELYPVSTDVWYFELDGSWYDLTFITADGETDSTWIRNRAFVVPRSEDVADGGKSGSDAGRPDRAQVERALHDARVTPSEMPPALRARLSRVR